MYATIIQNLVLYLSSLTAPVPIGQKFHFRLGAKRSNAKKNSPFLGGKNLYSYQLISMTLLG